MQHLDGFTLAPRKLGITAERRLAFTRSVFLMPVPGMASEPLVSGL